MSFEGPVREIHCEVSNRKSGASISCDIYAPRWSRSYRCKVDPGAGLTIIPHHIWSEECNVDDIMDLDDFPNVTGAGNAKLSCKIGSLQLCVEGYRDPPTGGFHVGTPLVGVEKSILILGECQVLYNMNPEHDRPHILLGLGGGTFQKGGFCINWQGLAGKPKAVFVEQLPEAD